MYVKTLVSVSDCWESPSYLIEYNPQVILNFTLELSVPQGNNKGKTTGIMATASVIHNESAQY